MAKVLVALTLVLLYAGYSALIYTSGTEERVAVTERERTSIQNGKAIFQQHNCQSCHQLYGLGGYPGPDLTTACSDPTRGEAYLRALLQSGGARMPDFGFTPEEINHLIAYLKYVDSTAFPRKIKP